MPRRRARPMPLFTRILFGYIFPWPFVIAGAVTMSIGIKNLLHASASPDWPTVPGMVISSEVEQHTDSEGDDSYHAAVEYDYEVDGTNYTGDPWLSGTTAQATPRERGRS